METLREVYQKFSDTRDSKIFQDLARKQLEEYKKTGGDIPEMDELDSLTSIVDILQDVEEQIVKELLSKGSKYTTSGGEIVKITKPQDYSGNICYKKGTNSFKSYYNKTIKELYGENMCVGHIDGTLPKEFFCPDFKEKCDKIVKSLNL